jgi:hypothetical protein
MAYGRVADDQLRPLSTMPPVLPSSGLGAFSLYTPRLVADKGGHTRPAGSARDKGTPHEAGAKEQPADGR